MKVILIATGKSKTSYEVSQRGFVSNIPTFGRVDPLDVKLYKNFPGTTDPVVSITYYLGRINRTPEGSRIYEGVKKYIQKYFDIVDRKVAKGQEKQIQLNEVWHDIARSVLALKDGCLCDVGGSPCTSPFCINQPEDPRLTLNRV